MILLIIGIVEMVVIFFLFLRKSTIKDIKKNISNVSMFIITVIIFYNIFFNINYLTELINDSYYPIIDKIGLIVLCFSISMVFDTIFIAVIQKIKEKIIVLKYEKNEENNQMQNYEYYRDTLGAIPPAMLLVCYDRKMNFEDVFIATILNLQLQKKIQIEDNKIKLLCDKTELYNHERFILGDYEYLDYSDQEIIRDRIKDLKKELFSKNILSDKWVIKNYFYDELIKEMKKEKYIYEQNEVIFDTTFMDIISLWIMLYFLTTILILTEFPSAAVLTGIGFVLTLVYLIFQSIIKDKANTIVRKEKALEIKTKMKGLKKFLKDFTLLENSEISEIKLYEEYIIYVIILNLKGKLNDKCQKIYNETKKIRNINITNDN